LARLLLIEWAWPHPTTARGSPHSASAITAGRRSTRASAGAGSAGKRRTPAPGRRRHARSLARLARAEALGISYREYTAVVLDTGVHL
jgi:hypothetical protein